MVVQNLYNSNSIVTGLVPVTLSLFFRESTIKVLSYLNVSNSIVTGLLPVTLPLYFRESTIKDILLEIIE